VHLARADPVYVGHPGRLHAGLIATITMCHLVWAATAAAHRQQGREIREPIDFIPQVLRGATS
jgi:hypothetical protein